jgi:SAM-dependent methyltransferase
MKPGHIDLRDGAAVRRFIDRSDELGGPDADATKQWWQRVEFVVPGWLRWQMGNFDPLSPEYFDLQEQLYTTIYGRRYTDVECELTQFDQEQAFRGFTAYPNWSPPTLNRYFRAMARLTDQFDAEGRLDILELGSGWGFSAEYMARLGHRVVGVDINQDFVAMASRRSVAAGLGIDYRQGTFESLPLQTDERFDVIFCFEAFHHCRHPLAALQVLRQAMRPEGQFILSGEPFIDPVTWPAWGLRTDPLSIYCIGKFGWWESGWTVAFMADLFRRVGLQMSFVDFHSDQERYMVGRVGNVFHARQLVSECLDAPKGWAYDGQYMTSFGHSILGFYRKLRGAVFVIQNFAPHELKLAMESTAFHYTHEELVPGRNEIMVETAPMTDCWNVVFSGELWNPKRELGSHDDRHISFHLEEIEELP